MAWYEDSYRIYLEPVSQNQVLVIKKRMQYRSDGQPYFVRDHDCPPVTLTLQEAWALISDLAQDDRGFIGPVFNGRILTKAQDDRVIACRHQFFSGHDTKQREQEWREREEEGYSPCPSDLEEFFRDDNKWKE